MNDQDRHDVLARLTPAAAVETDLLVVDNTATVKLEGLTVCNLSAAPTSFRFWIVPLGQVTDDNQALWYDLPIDGHDTFMATLTVTLRPSDVIRVYATLATLTFVLFGTKT